MGRKQTEKKTKDKEKKSGSRTKARRGDSATQISQLQGARDAGKKQFMLAEKTGTAYAGYIKRGKVFLADLVSSRKADLAAGNGGAPDVPDGNGEMIDFDELAVAFEKPPNRYSALALELFMVEKCMNQDLGIQTGQSTYSAFKKHWEMMNNDTYRGPYAYDETQKRVSGNPALSAQVQDILHTIENKSRAGGDGRNHAEAMTIGSMKKMMEWSEQTCPSDWLEKDIKDLGTLLTVSKHFLMRAFMSSGFTIWTRNSELCGLQRRHYKQDCEGREPYFVPHDLVRLENRKGWTRRTGASHAIVGNEYEIYEQKKTPEIDMHFHLRQWVLFLEKKLLVRPLKADEYIFPAISVNGMTHANKTIDHDVVQKYLSEFAASVNLTADYSTHCFRRGGAQYRFMQCPLGERWSLSTVRWWGGWAEGEHADTLIRYLVDELHAYENTHSDALHPLQREANVSFNGDHILTSPVTAAELREFKTSLDRKIDGLAVEAAKLVLTGLGSIAAGTTASVTPHSGLPNSIVAVSSQPTTYGSPGPSRQAQAIQNMRSGQTATTQGPRRAVPAIRGAVIPNLPRGASAWHEAVKQWEEADITSGYALKDWPIEWYTGEMKNVTATKRTQRKVITAEYERMNRDDEEFIREYPEANQGIKALLAAINKKRMERNELIQRRSKNGTPNERGPS
ncbi:hypothetical protein B0H21DRAFT_848678 [Amylocystis lapponica]|nr:hypothetical protein B0H21DRAFT_848678 [Amylocystis lapponica]